MDTLLLAFGSHGDVHPVLGVGQALVRRGHDVRVMAHPYFQPDIDAAGLSFRPVGADIDVHGLMRHPDLFHRRRGSHVVMNSVLTAVPDFIAGLNAELDARRPDVIVAHLICIGVRWVAQQRRIPLATITLAPPTWFSRLDPVPALQKRRGQFWRAASYAVHPLLRPLIRLLTDGRINRIRRACGFPPERDNLLRDFQSGDVNLGLWSTCFRDAMPDDPPRARICGFTWYDGGARRPSPPELRAFLDDGPPPVVFSLGSAAYHGGAEFYALAAQACGVLGRRGVLLSGAPEYAPRELPAGVMACDYAPFAELLPRAAAVVHHGGIGSTAQTLRAGRPSLLVAHAHDQFNNGLRVERLGAGRMLPRHTLSARRLSAALDALLNDSAAAGAASQLGRKLAREDGAAVAVRHIEDAARRGVRPAAAPPTEPRP
ncbi:MAG: O-mycaminosyltylonolide 6-deoxyallosyltransferase [Phycisphaerae bacterium]|nr:O-mycaminosyltylonolide 6-deoxyallosyltransferase [Phycisphaerae bacterium]